LVGGRNPRVHNIGYKWKLVVNFRFQSIYLWCPFDNGPSCSRSSQDAVANTSKSALLSGVEPGFLI